MCHVIVHRYFVHDVGSQDGTVHVWSADTGERITVLDGGHPGPTHCVQFNPKFMMMASACTSMVSGRGVRGREGGGCLMC